MNYLFSPGKGIRFVTHSILRIVPLGILVSLLVILSSSCSSQTPKVQPGKVADDVAFITRPGLTYAIYLPTVYTSAKRWPVIFAFDPEGDGLLPVEKYHHIAEQFGCILVGSNQSKNGQTLQQLENNYTALLQEIRERYSIEPSLIFCTGFSGGSRAASILAYYRGNICGVIACGAGFPATGQPPRHDVPWFGIVGNEDFNYLEMIKMQDDLSRYHIPHRLRIFDGKHAWPPAEIWEQGLGWQWVQAIQKGLIPSDPTLANRVDEQLNQSQIDHPFPSKELQNKELQLQSQLMQAMQQESPAWWERKYRQLHSGDDQEQRLMNKRLLSYAGMIAYIMANQELRNHSRTGLERIIRIYTILEPENDYIATLKNQLNKMP